MFTNLEAMRDRPLAKWEKYKQREMAKKGLNYTRYGIGGYVETEMSWERHPLSEEIHGSGVDNVRLNNSSNVTTGLDDDGNLDFSALDPYDSALLQEDPFLNDGVPRVMHLPGADRIGYGENISDADRRKVLIEYKERILNLETLSAPRPKDVFILQDYQQLERIECNCSRAIAGCIHKDAIPYVRHHIRHPMDNDPVIGLHFTPKYKIFAVLDDAISLGSQWVITRLFVNSNRKVSFHCQGIRCRNGKIDVNPCRHIEILRMADPVNLSFSVSAVAQEDDIKDSSISWKPIPPPFSSLITLENLREEDLWPQRVFRAAEAAFRTPGAVFYLENDSQCICGLKITDCTSPRRLRWSKLYDENGAVTCFVETAKCTQCPSRSNRYIGPDLGNLGIFNKNNFCLVTHFFLDKITELITSTTFSFYVYHKHLKSNYNEYGA
ncbi:hypothetical protein BC829DRAFT_423717, partial [Chytridium lagenaria]